MQHFEVHVLKSLEDLALAEEAGLLDSAEHLMFGTTCDNCVQMLLLEKHESVFVVVDERASHISCSTCLTDLLGAGMLEE